MNRSEAYERLDAHLDEYYYPGARDDLREVATGALITEADYWREPTYVFTGATWLLVGGVIGYVVRVLLG